MHNTPDMAYQSTATYVLRALIRVFPSTATSSLSDIRYQLFCSFGGNPDCDT